MIYLSVCCIQWSFHSHLFTSLVRESTKTSGNRPGESTRVKRLDESSSWIHLIKTFPDICWVWFSRNPQAWDECAEFLRLNWKTEWEETERKNNEPWTTSLNPLIIMVLHISCQCLVVFMAEILMNSINFTSQPKISWPNDRAGLRAGSVHGGCFALLSSLRDINDIHCLSNFIIICGVLLVLLIFTLRISLWYSLSFRFVSVSVSLSLSLSLSLPLSLSPTIYSTMLSNLFVISSLHMFSCVFFFFSHHYLSNTQFVCVSLSFFFSLSLSRSIWSLSIFWWIFFLFQL